MSTATLPPKSASRSQEGAARITPEDLKREIRKRLESGFFKEELTPEGLTAEERQDVIRALRVASGGELPKRAMVRKRLNEAVGEKVALRLFPIDVVTKGPGRTELVVLMQKYTSDPRTWRSLVREVMHERQSSVAPS